MTKNQYFAIAEAISDVKAEHRSQAALTALGELEFKLAFYFQHDDPAFSCTLFLSACKLPDAEVGS